MNKLISKTRTLFLISSSRLTRGIRVRLYFKKHPIKKIQIGCGSNVLKGWLNSDVRPISTEVIYINAKKPLPFRADIFDYAYSEHFLEHLDYFSSKKFLEECFRILKPNGKIRISTPDLEKIVALSSAKSAAKKKYIEWSLQFFGKLVQSKYKLNNRAYWPYALNNMLNGFDHKFVYSYGLLELVLSDIGFKSIKKEKILHSRDTNLEKLEGHGKIIGKDQNEFESMVVEATKAQ